MEVTEEESDLNSKEEILLPPRPTEPLSSECCGTGCTPCVFDIYKTQMKQWEKDCQEIITNGYCKSQGENSDTSEQFLTPERYNAFQILKIHQETKCVKIFTFSWKSFKTRPIFKDEDFPIKIGQHVLIRLQETQIFKDNDASDVQVNKSEVLAPKMIPRQYTVLRINAAEQTFEILIKIYPEGQLTPYLDKLAVGDFMEMRGPFGHIFDYKPNSRKDILMVSAGTGIACMIRLIQKILDNEEDDTKIKLLFACKTFSEVLLVRQLKEWESYWNFQVFYYFSGEQEIAGESKGNCSGIEIPYYGMKFKMGKRLDCDELKELLKTSKCDISKILVMICGTKAFEKDLINHCKNNGIVGDSNVIAF